MRALEQPFREQRAWGCGTFHREEENWKLLPVPLFQEVESALFPQEGSEP